MSKAPSGAFFLWLWQMHRQRFYRIQQMHQIVGVHTSNRFECEVGQVSKVSGQLRHIHLRHGRIDDIHHTGIIGWIQDRIKDVEPGQGRDVRHNDREFHYIALPSLASLYILSSSVNCGSG